MITRRRCRSFPLSETSLALAFKGKLSFSPPLQGEGWVGMVLVLGFGLQRSRDNRLTSVCVLSAIHGRQLLSFACPKESNQRKRHPRIRAARGASGSLRANGFRPQAIHGLLSKSARSLAPPALRAAGPSALRRCSEGSRRARAKECKETDVSHISGASAAGTAALCSSRFPLGRGKDSEEKPRSGGRQDAGHFDESTWMCSRRSPPSPCVVTRAWMPA